MADEAPAPARPSPQELFGTAPAAPARPSPQDLFGAPEEPQGIISKGLAAGEELGRGIVTGVINPIQGLTETAAAALDLSLGTNTSRSVTDFFNSTTGGLRPETGVGETISEITSFGFGFIPIVGWLGRADKVAKAVKAGQAVIPSTSRFLRTAENFGKSAKGQALLGSRAKFFGTTAAAAGGYETLFSPDGRTTLADTFDIAAPLQTEPDTGLMGREEALRRLRNKGRSGVEGAAMSGLFDTALAGLGAGVGAVGRTEAAAATARGVRAGLGAAGAAVKALPGAEAVGRVATKYLTPSGGADPRVFENIMDTTARTDATQARAISLFSDYEKEMNRTLKAMKLNGSGKEAAKEGARDLFFFLTGNGPRLEKYGEEVAKAADRLLDVANNGRTRFIETVERELDTALPGTAREIKLKEQLELMKEYQEAEKGYLRRSFEVHTDPLSFYKKLDITGKGKKLYDEAVVEVSRNAHGEAWDTKQALASAKYIVNESLGLKTINTGLSPDTAVKQLMTSLKKQQLNPEGGLFAKEMPKLKLSPSLLTSRKAIVEESPKLRALLGEITDPRQLYLQTIGDVSKTTEALRFYQNTFRSDMVSSLDSAVVGLQQGRRPTFVKVPDATNPTSFDSSPFLNEARRIRAETTVPSALNAGISSEIAGDIEVADVIKNYTEELVQNGYIKLGGEADKFAPLTEQVNDTDVFAGPYGALTGLYVTPETYQAMTAPLRMGINGLDEVRSMFVQLRGLSQKMTIVPNPESQIRNIIGNVAMLAATANLGRSTEIFDLLKLFTTNLQGLNEQGLSRLSKTISLSGVTESSLVIKALQEYKDAGADLALSGKLRSKIEKIEGAIPLMQFFERIYSDSDSFFKGVAVVSEQNKLMKAFVDSGLMKSTDDMADIGVLKALQDAGLAKRLYSEANPELSALEVISADTVKDMFPIYNRVGLAFKKLDATGLFGNFTSFAAENIRNSVNILDRGLKEMSFALPANVRDRIGEDAATAFERSIRAQGAQRLTAYVAVATVIPKAAVRASMAATGTTPDQMEAFYSQSPPFLAGHDIAILENDQKGKLQYIDLSTVMPYSFAVDSMVSGVRAYNEAGTLGKNEASQIASGIWASLKSYSDPFASQAMSAERILDVVPRELMGRGGVTLTGARVYEDTDTLSEKIGSSIAHLSATYIPGYMRELGEVRSGEFRPGRIMRAVTGMPGPQGQDFEPSVEFARLVTGFTPMEMNLRRDFQYVGKEYSPRRQETKTAATRIIRAPDRTPDEMRDAWSKYLDKLYVEQTKLYADVKAARTLGLPDKDIQRQLIKDAKLGSDEVNSIMQGRFYPGEISKELLEDVRLQELSGEVNRLTAAKDIPVQDFMKMTRDRMRQELIPEAPTGAAPVRAPSAKRPSPTELFGAPPAQGAPAKRPSPAELFGAPERQGAATPPPVFAPAPVPSAPQLPTAPTNRASLSPSLLGGDLASQMANAEIASRLSG